MKTILVIGIVYALGCLVLSITDSSLFTSEHQNTSTGVPNGIQTKVTVELSYYLEYDQNDDGMIEYKEVTNPIHAEVFTLLDIDRNGYVTQEEIAEFMIQGIVLEGTTGITSEIVGDDLTIKKRSKQSKSFFADDWLMPLRLSQDQYFEIQTLRTDTRQRLQNILQHDQFERLRFE